MTAFGDSERFAKCIPPGEIRPRNFSKFGTAEVETASLDNLEYRGDSVSTWRFAGCDILRTWTGQFWTSQGAAGLLIGRGSLREYPRA